MKKVALVGGSSLEKPHANMAGNQGLVLGSEESLLVAELIMDILLVLQHCNDER